jgi:hypothetical protein
MHSRNSVSAAVSSADGVTLAGFAGGHACVKKMPSTDEERVQARRIATCAPGSSHRHIGTVTEHVWGLDP